MLTGVPMTEQPIIAPNKAIGNPIIADKGLVQLSYWAASTRNATNNAMMNTMVVVLPACVS